MPVNLSGCTMKACVIRSVLAVPTAEWLILLQTWHVLSKQTCGTDAFSHSQESTVSGAQSSSATPGTPQLQQQSSLLLGASPTQDIQNALNTPGFLCALSTSATVPHSASFSPFKSPSTFCWKNARRDGRHHMSSKHTEAPKTCCRVSRSKNYILTHPVSHEEWK